MATRKSSSSSSGSGESSTGLVVSLVLFVLLTIGLGVTTWLGYSGQADLKGKADQAEAKARTSDQRAQEQEAVTAALRIGAGVDSEADRTLFSGRKAQASAKLAEQAKALRGLPPWDINSPANRPPKSYVELLTETQQALANAQAQTRGRENDLNEARKQFEADKQELNAKLQASDKKLKEANAAVLAAQSLRAGGADKASEDVKNLTEQVAKLTLEKDTLNVELGRTIKRQEDVIENYKKVREALAEKIGPLMDKVAAVAEARPEFREVTELHELLTKQFDKNTGGTDTPKGQVVKVDRERELVYVNLGSADYIRPQVSFSVMPAGSTGRSAASRARKGAIEIVSVLEAHLSTAKIVEEGNRFRDPIMAGDTLFNPAWNPNNPEHVALTGIFDLNGDGQDDTQDLIRLLDKQGVVVDAWLDLRTRQVKGTITERTSYLIVGERPNLPQEMLAQESNPIGVAAREVIARITEMETKAKDMGVSRTPYRKYLAMAGFRIPKGTAEIGAGTYLRGVGATKPPPDSEDRPK